MGTLKQLVHNRPLLTFMLGHFTVDMYGGLLPVLYALLALEFGMDYPELGFVALCYTTASSLSQPVFGYIADRFGSRILAPLSILWTTVMVGLAGFSPDRTVLMLIAGLAGLGSGAYHPLGAANAAAVTGQIQKNTAMSLYTIGGTSGFALGPLLGAALFSAFDRYGTIGMLPFGVLSAVLMIRSLNRLGIGRPGTQQPAARPQSHAAIPWRLLAPVLAVTMLRSWVFLSIVTFVPFWYGTLNYPSSFYGLLTSLIIGFGAAGTLLGGILADRVGQRQVLLGSFVLSFPALFLFVGFPGPIALLTGPIFGLIADASLSITLVMAQRLLPGRAGMASGFILGMGFVTGGIGVPITGKLAAVFGIQPGLMMLSGLLVLAIVSTLLIPREVTQPMAPPYRPAHARADD